MRDRTGFLPVAAVTAAARALIPTDCVACGRAMPERGAPICGLCRVRLPRLPRPRCERCAEPLGRRPAPDAPDGRCGTCEDWPEAPETTSAPFEYRGAVPAVVRALKYGGWRRLAPWMARTMVPEADAILRRPGWPPGTVIVPVPLGRARLRERGFNQALDLAVPIARAVDRDLAPVLGRGAGGGRQAGAGRRFRRTNLSGRFFTEPGHARDAAILVDDVLTTGSTAFACAAALVQAGFSRVAVITFARASRAVDAA